MHHQGARSCLQQFRIDLITLKLRLAERLLLLLAHAHPHIGVEHIRPRRRLGRVRRHHDVAAAPRHQIGRRLKPRWRANPQLESPPCRRPDPGPRHVAIPVPDKSDPQLVEIPPCLADAEQIRQHLARMLLVRQRIDGGDAAELGEDLHVALRKRADHRPVQHPPHDPGGVLDRFAPSKLDIVRRQKNHIPAQFPNSHLERDARAGGRFGKHQGPAFVPQRMRGMTPPLGLHHSGQRDNFFDLRLGQRLNREQMLHPTLKPKNRRPVEENYAR